MLVMPSSPVRANRSSSRAAPSSMEYSVWTWRWTKSDPDGMGGEVLLSGSCAVRSGGRAGRTTAWTDQLGEGRQPTRPLLGSWQGAPTVTSYDGRGFQLAHAWPGPAGRPYL